MCFDLDSAPPIPPISRRGGLARRPRPRGRRREPLRRVRRVARGAAPAPASSILPDVRGLYRFYEELALRFAERGYAAVAFDYFGRTAGAEKRGDDFEYMPHVAADDAGGRAGATSARASRTSAPRAAPPSSRSASASAAATRGSRPQSDTASPARSASTGARARATTAHPGPIQRAARDGRRRSSRSRAATTPGSRSRTRRRSTQALDRRRRRARGRDLPRRAAQLLRPQARGVRRRLRGRVEPRPRLPRALRPESAQIGSPRDADSDRAKIPEGVRVAAASRTAQHQLASQQSGARARVAIGCIAATTFAMCSSSSSPRSSAPA